MGDLVGESFAREIELPYLQLLPEPDARLQLYRLRTDKFLPLKSIDVWPERVAMGEVISNLVDKYKTTNVLVVYNTANGMKNVMSCTERR